MSFLSTIVYYSYIGNNLLRYIADKESIDNPNRLFVSFCGKIFRPGPLRIMDYLGVGSDNVTLVTNIKCGYAAPWEESLPETYF
jgi:hypothetical protein